MQLLVHVIEARGLRARDPNELSDPYVRVQLAKCRSRTEVVKKTLSPYWDEEFSFLVGDLRRREKLAVSVLDGDNDKLLGQLKLPLSKILDSNNLSVGDAWYELQPKNKNSKNGVCGEIRLSISFSHSNSNALPNGSQTSNNKLTPSLDQSYGPTEYIPSSSSSVNMELSPLLDVECNKSTKEEKPDVTPIIGLLRQFLLGKNVEPLLLASKDINPLEELNDDTLLANSEACENQTDNESSSIAFEELVQVMESKDEGGVMPVNLAGGVLVDKSYIVSPGEMNSLLFSPTSAFLQSLPEVQGTSDYQAEAWRLENGGASLKRIVSYIKAASKLIKAIKAVEEQIYLKADGKSYAVLSSVSTPDAPFGTYFKTEILYCITPGHELPSEDPSCHLIISWRMNFIQSTMMKSMIENGARQGLNEGFASFSEQLSQYVKLVDAEGIGSSKGQILASLQTEQEPDWKMSFQILGSFSFIFCAFLGLYIFIHIHLAKTSIMEGLEFWGLDLPDSFGEIVLCGLLILQGQHVWNRIRHLFHARKQGGKDHGIKAQGDGWLLTVALIEGSIISTIDQSGFSDPYVVFTCNGKTKTSSIKFQTANPMWNEIFEFDATCDPPSRMEVVVYDFVGPFDDVTPLGHSEVNFVKCNLSDLADVWIPLQGKAAQACRSKLHLRIFLDNTRGNEVVMEYLTKMGKEVGKKMNLRSPQTNSAFQKLFCLPLEEFLINDYTCYLKRKMPLQGRLFLSPRIIGFYANLFGHKTKFFLLWEDIDDIQLIPPSLASVGSPSIMIILRKGRGAEAKHAAKTLDQDGRLKFHFQSFVYFNAAHRTIIALWKARSLSPEQKVQIAEKSDIESLHTEESGSSFGAEDAKMSKIFSSSLPIPVNALMEIFEGGVLEQKLMKKIGFCEYSPEPWQQAKPDVYQRQINYKFDKSVFGHGGEVVSIQQRSCTADRKEWIVEETTALQGLLLADYFSLQLKYQIKSLPSKPLACSVNVFLGISWLKSIKHQKRITKSVTSHSILCLKAMFRQAEKELVPGKK